jgi:FkbM family methyltransferase
MLRQDKPFFVSIGANNGVANDPIWPFLSKHAWPGIALEPNPAVFAQLEKNYRDYPGVRCVNAAIGEKDGTAPFYVVDPGKSDNALGWAEHQLSSFDRNTILKHASQMPGLEGRIRETSVATISWASLLALAGGRAIDVLHVDTEGFDAEVIRMLDLSITKPSLIQFEHINISKSDQEECISKLVTAGYQVARNSFDIIAYQWKSLA